MSLSLGRSQGAEIAAGNEKQLKDMGQVGGLPSSALICFGLGLVCI